MSAHRTKSHRGRVLLILAAVAACFLLLVFDRQPHTEIVSVHGSMTAVVAVCVSGAPRSAAVLERFAASLLQHVVRPAATQQHALFDIYILMNDPAAEALLDRLLVGEPAVRRVVTPSAGGATLGAQATEDVAIARDHRASMYGSAWHAERSTNTLRMLHKLREVEALRAESIATRGQGQAHSWVLRIRPDLELTAPLPLPPLDTSAGAVVRAYAPWLCEGEQLSSDQLLLLPADPTSRRGVDGGPLARLSHLYEPSRLSEAMMRSVPPSLYPERLVWHTLGRDLHAWPGSAEGRVGVRLLAADGSSRDPYAKLRADFPKCFGRA